MTTTKNYFDLSSVESKVQKDLGTPDFTQLTEGLGFEYRRSKPGDVYIVDGCVTIRHDGEGSPVYVLTQGSIKALERKLDAEFREVKVGEWYLSKWNKRWIKCSVVSRPAMPHFVRNPEVVARVTYEHASKAWVEDIGLKEGDKVRVAKTADSHELGWQNSWMPDMAVGLIGTVKRINHIQGIQVDSLSHAFGTMGYPFFALEKYVEPVKAPEPKVDIKIEVPPPPRRVDAGLPIQPGDFLDSDRRMKTFQSYRDSVPRMTSTTTTYYRDTWTRADYKARQAAWVQFYDIKQGSTVKVCGPATTGLDGWDWDCSWTETMNKMVGNTYEVNRVHHNGISIRALGTTWNVPFYILKPEPKTVVPAAPVAPARRKLTIGVPLQPGDFAASIGNDRTARAYDSDYPLFAGGNSLTYHRVPWTAEEYETRQKAWVDHFGLHPGRYVKVCAKADHQQDGWAAMWNDRMDDLVGNTYPITEIHSLGIQIKDNYDHWDMPFHVLQPVDGPKVVEPKYRAFKTPAEVSDWVKAHGSAIVGPEFWGEVDRARLTLGVLEINGLMSLNSTAYMSDRDNTPFGVKV